MRGGREKCSHAERSLLCSYESSLLGTERLHNYRPRNPFCELSVSRPAIEGLFDIRTPCDKKCVVAIYKQWVPVTSLGFNHTSGIYKVTTTVCMASVYRGFSSPNLSMIPRLGKGTNKSSKYAPPIIHLNSDVDRFKATKACRPRSEHIQALSP